MAKHWKEQLDPARHRNHMWGAGCEVNETRDLTLDPRWVYFVRECGFTFEFHSLGQLAVCLDYLSKKTRPSTRIPSVDLTDYGGDHSETQRWFERLPQWLFAETKRTRLVKALEQARRSFEVK